MSRDRLGRTGTVLCLLALGIALSGCMRSPQQKEARFLAAGKRDFEKKDYARAMLEFKNAARLNPRDAEPVYQLGVTYLAAGDPNSAVACFLKAIEVNPGHAGAQLRLAQVLAIAGNKDALEDARSRLQKFLKTSPADSDALNTLALTELKLGKPQGATQLLEQALEKSPGQLVSSVMLAQAKLSQNDRQGAEEVLKKACDQEPKAAGPRIALGSLYANLDRYAEAEQQFQRAVEIEPKSGPALLDLAVTQNYLGRKPEAEQNFRRLSELPEKKYKAVYAKFLFEDGRRDEAIREFEKLAKVNPNDRVARAQLVTAYRAVNRVADAEKILTEALQQNRKDLDALLQRSELFLDAGKYAEAQMDLNEVLHLKPNSPEAHYVMSRVHQKRGAALSQRQELSEALRLNPYLLPARLELAQLLVASNGAKTALGLLNETPDFQKRSLPVLVERNWALWVLGDMAELRKGIDQGLSQLRLPDLLIQDGLWKLRQGKSSEARAVLEEALKVNPTDLRALAALSGSYLTQNQTPMGLQKVKEYASRQPKSAPVQQFLGTLLLANGDRAQARAALAASITADPKFVPAHLSLAQLDTAEGKWDDARARLRTVLALDSRNVTARLWLGNIEEKNGNHQAAIQYYREVVDADGNNARALNNLAYLLAEYANQPDEALKYAQKAKELNPSRPGVEDTLGWVFYRKGLYTLALEHLERAASQKGDPVWKYHLAMAYAKAGDLKRGRATLEAALKMDPNVREAKMAKELLGRAK